MAGVSVHVDTSGISNWKDKTLASVNRAAYRAGIDASRRMKAEGSRQVRERKNLRRSEVSSKVIRVVGPKSAKDVLVWYVSAGIVSQRVFSFLGGKPSRTGWTVSFNKGTSTTIAHAFKAKMRSGYVGVFMRYGEKTKRPTFGYKGHAKYARKRRQPIRELFAAGISSPFKFAIPAMAERGRAEFVKSYTRNLRSPR